MTDSKNAAARRASTRHLETLPQHPNDSSAPSISRANSQESASQTPYKRKKHPRKMFRLEPTPILYFQQLRSHFN
jgi:hypothetical protein